jgi:aspartyl-tRNA(Asn)/glutamyl-tRNA(Gln) amidotransferase subunit B
LQLMCQEVIDNPTFVEQVNAVTSGEKPKLIGFFVGQVMKLSNGQADPKTVTKVLKELLGPK